MPWLRRLNLWLLTIGSQGEAKGKMIEMNGSQEAKSLWTLSNICTKTRPFSVKNLQSRPEYFQGIFC